MNSQISLDDIDALVFDFDGVLTNNQVHLNDKGDEYVSCCRSDGLAFDVLRKLKKPSFIVSTETNLVVTSRAKKLKIPVFQGIKNKINTINEIAFSHSFELKNILYVGNDLNDYLAMQLCGYTACPSDSHQKIKSISKFVLKTRGGHGVVRELLEDIFKIDIIKVLYSN